MEFDEISKKLIVEGDAHLDCESMRVKVLEDIDNICNVPGIINLDNNDLMDFVEMSKKVYATHISTSETELAKVIGQRVSDIIANNSIAKIERMLIQIYQDEVLLSLSEITEALEELRAMYGYEFDMMIGIGTLEAGISDTEITILIGE